MKTRVTIRYVLLHVIPLAALAFAGSCTGSEPERSENDGYASAPVVVGASEYLMGSASTRTDGGMPVSSRKMLFTYPSRPSGQMKSAVCMFDAKGYGYVHVGEGGDPLRWDDIYTEKPGGCDVYLDNLLDYPVQVPDRTGNDPLRYYDNFIHIYFGHGETVKNEKVMVAEAGSPEAENGIDIVWGKIDKAQYGKSLHFALKHKMSQLTFRFTADDDGILKQLAQGKTTVSLEKVQRSLIRQAGQPHPMDDRLVPFNRQTGVIEHTGRSEQDVICFADGEPLKGTDQSTYYASRTMVLPPFTWIVNYPIPILRVELGDGSQYAGGMPIKIDYWTTDKSGTPILMSMDLAFQPGYHTVFDVKLVESLNNKEILFQNVMVEPWLLRYNDEITVTESGIHSWEDLRSLTEVFNEDPSDANLRLIKYGTWNGDRWVFKLWRDIDGSAGMPLPQFDSGDFEIDFGQYTITVGDTEITGANYKEILVKQS